MTLSGDEEARRCGGHEVFRWGEIKPLASQETSVPKSVVIGRLSCDVVSVTSDARQQRPSWRCGCRPAAGKLLSHVPEYRRVVPGCARRAMMGLAVEWRTLSEEDLGRVVDLAQRCQVADGGLPGAVSPSFLLRRYTGDGVAAVGATIAGRLVASGALRLVGGSPVVGQVDPAHRGRGLGGDLLDRLLRRASYLAYDGQASVRRRGLHSVGVPGSRHRADRVAVVDGLIRSQYTLQVDSRGIRGQPRRGEQVTPRLGRADASSAARLREPIRLDQTQQLVHPDGVGRAVIDPPRAEHTVFGRGDRDSEHIVEQSAEAQPA